MTKHPIETAFADPTTADAIKQNLAAAFPLVLEAADDLTDMSLTGLVVREVRVRGVAFVFDPNDETSEHDGVTTLVSQDGQRFKAQADPGAFVAVLSILNDPPALPAIGDKHIVGMAPMGDWAANADDLAVYTSRGWEFAAPAIGQRVYVRGLDAYRYWSEAGAWTEDGLTNGSVSAWEMQFPFGMPVESEIATPPGGTPAAGTKWIVAANATGAWDDWDGDIAEADGQGGFTRHTAYDGATVYDRNKRVRRSFDSGSGEWLDAGGVVIARPDTVISNSTSGTSSGGNDVYNYSGTNAPTANQNRRIDAIGITHEARAAGNPLLIRYRADITLDVGSSWIGQIPIVAALFRDSESNAVDWCAVGVVTAGLTPDSSPIVGIDVTFEIPATSGVHSYFVGIMDANSGANSIQCAAMNRRRLSLMEVGG